jgi:peptidylprolyl isomerase
MIKSYKILVLLFSFLIYCFQMSANDHINMKLKDGNVIIKLRPDLAPNHVKRISQLVKEGFYNGLNFHRVIPGFMAQGGDPLGNGTGGSGKNIAAEFSSEKHIRGTVSMARAQDPNSADSQFFICFEDASWLDGQYTIWGQVVEGMEYVDKIKQGDGGNGEVQNPDKIISMKLVSLKKKKKK